MKIARIQQRPNVNRVRVFFEDDDAPYLELAVDLLLRAGLAPGDTLSPAKRDELERENETYRAREAALSLLGHRARAAVELRRRLARKDFSEAVIDEVMAWLDERGYIDDRAFAEAFVRDRLRLRPRGRMALRQELRKKGVEIAVAEAAIDAVMDAGDVGERDLARQAAEAWARKNRSALRGASRSSDDRMKVRRRLYGHLARRGFASDAVRAAISAVLDD